MPTITDDQLRSLAIMGARSRKAALQAEIDALDRVIEDLVTRGKGRLKRTKPHWTQTAAGRAKLSKSLKAYHRNKTTR